MNWLEIVNYDIISLILSFLGGPIMFLNNSDLIDIIEYDYAYATVKKELHDKLNFWSFTPHPIDGHARQAYRNTDQQVKAIKDYWTFRFREHHPYATHSPLPDLDIHFITDKLSIPICNLLRGEHKTNARYREHYHIK